MTDPERLRIAKQFIGATAQLLRPTHEQIEQLTFALAKILHVEADDITASAQLDFLAREVAAMKTGVAAAIVGIGTLGGQISMPQDVATRLGLERQEKSNIVIVGR